MKIRYILPALVLILGSVLYSFINGSPELPSPPRRTATSEQHAQKAGATTPPKSLPGMSEPVTFIAPSIGISAPIEKVGLTKSGDMDVPISETSLGWYNGGAFPGNPGPAVLAGHTGTPNKPSLFRKLDTLKKGEIIRIQDTSGTKASFQIIETAAYTPGNAPRQRIFGPTTTARLVIITCSGTWIPQQSTYSHRLVLYSVRINDAR